MRFDRIVADLVRFINTLLWWRKGAVDSKTPPYTAIGSPIRGDRGILQEIQRNLPSAIPNREVSYWIFWERRESTNQPSRDIHVVCAYLGAIEGGKTIKPKEQRRSIAPTHRIEVMWASHWVKKDGTWDCEQIHSGDYDLQGNQPTPHLYAPMVLKKVAVQLLVLQVEELNWDFEIESSRKEVMKAHYTTPRPKAKRHSTINLTPQQATINDHDNQR